MNHLPEANSMSSGIENGGALPRLDWIVLPMIGILTMVVLMISGEVTARIFWPAQQKDACLIDDPTQGAHYRPNCKSTLKAAEGSWVDNSYNECGFRTRESCGPRPPGTLRVAVLGSSYSFGYLVPYESAYTTMAGEALSRQCKRRVEFQNLGAIGVDLRQAYGRADEALALKPDVLLLVIAPFDLSRLPSLLSSTGANPKVGTPKKLQTANWLLEDVVAPLRSSRMFTVLQHYMYRKAATYADYYLLGGDTVDYLKTPFNENWQQRFRALDTILAQTAQKAHAASVPVAIMIGPSAAQAALLNLPPRPGIAPKAVEAEISGIASKNGIMVIDPLPGFEGRSDVMSAFYAVDGHPGPEAQRIFAGTVEKTLLLAGYPAFSSCTGR
jgi:hypothetical protein